MASKTMGRARVSVTIEVDLGDAWGPDCSVEQIFKQAKESARNQIDRATRNGGLPGWRIVGEPKVTAILFEKET
jgi:hypothetical protein